MCVQVISVTSYFFLPFHYSEDTEFPLYFYLFLSCLIVCLHSFCDGFDNFAYRTHVQKQRWKWSLRCIMIRQLTIIFSSLMKWIDSPLYSVRYTRKKVVYEEEYKYKRRTKFLGLNITPRIQQIIQVTLFTTHKTTVSNYLFVGVKCGLLT
jgi:hypothetical protein